MAWWTAPRSSSWARSTTSPPACGGSRLEPGGAGGQRALAGPVAGRDQRRTSPNVAVSGRPLGGGRPQVPGKWTNILHPAFAAYVKSQLEQASQLVTAAGRAHGVPDRSVHGRGGAARRGRVARGQSGAAGRLQQAHSRGRGRASPTTESAVDLFGAACPGGKYASKVHGVRSAVDDGVHFTPPGGVYLAPKIMPAIVAAGRAQMAGGTATGLSRRVTPASGSRSGCCGACCSRVGRLRVDVRVGVGDDALGPQRRDEVALVDGGALGDGRHEGVPRAVVGVGGGGQRKGRPQLLIGFILELRAAAAGASRVTQHCR